MNKKLIIKEFELKESKISYSKITKRFDKKIKHLL